MLYMQAQHGYLSAKLLVPAPAANLSLQYVSRVSIFLSVKHHKMHLSGG